MLISVQTIVDSAIDLADMRNSQFIDQSGAAGTELIRYVNLAKRDLYNQIVQVNEHYFTTTSNINIVGSTDTYSLPADFYKLDGADLQIAQDRYLTLRPFMFAERNKFRSGLAISSAPHGLVFKYLLVGNSIRFLPMPQNPATVQIWYTPTPTVITSFTDTVETVVGGDEYMSLYVAMAMLIKEESDVTALDGKRREVLDQLKVVLRQRDIGSPKYITDEATLNIGSLFPFRGNY
jgi:hypothetical protein